MIFEIVIVAFAIIGFVASIALALFTGILLSYMTYRDKTEKESK